MNIHWICGFINADGSFLLSTYKKANSGEICSISITITQHNKSIAVLEAIKNYFGYGSIYNNKKNISNYIIRSIKLINNFIESFAKAQLLGAKALDYKDFCKGVNIMNQKAYLTSEGFAYYKSIVAGMNSTQTVFSIESNQTTKPTQEKSKTAVAIVEEIND